MSNAFNKPPSSLFWEKVGDQIEREEIRIKFSGDEKKYFKYCDDSIRKILIEGAQKRFIVKQFLTNGFGNRLSYIIDDKYSYDLPIEEIIKKEILYRLPITFGSGL